ncbi:hypothetical protein B0H15DRAFT_933706 [Mycena belliarum]|uniref:MYND-type domain-containing protein n=1 Tax=Mycena belliarum TaxID=1033014 RepID=A0AAD6TT77_9AGAR|nr:hypothetical protein B0H15DRAFT_933706 [Mycena belliae]
MEALLERGIVTALTLTAKLSFSPSSRDALPRQLLRASLALLTDFFRRSLGYRWIKESLKAGLLGVIVACQNETQSQTLVVLCGIIDVVQRSLVYRSVIRQFSVSLCDVHQTSLEGIFAEDDINELWNNFLAVARNFFAIMLDLDANKLVSARACDYLECGLIALKADFRRCSGCSTAHYCSEACQGKDWSVHRRSCEELRITRNKSRDGVSRRDRAFFGALVDRVYFQERTQIIPEVLSFMREFPDQIPSIIFNYANPEATCNIHLASIHEFDEFPKFVSHAERSGGRMQIHGINVADGSKERLWIFPLRSATADVMTELQLISKETSSGSAAEAERVAALINLDVVEIH